MMLIALAGMAAIAQAGDNPWIVAARAKRFSKCVVVALERAQHVAPGGLKSTTRAELDAARASCKDAKEAWRLEMRRAIEGLPPVQRRTIFDDVAAADRMVQDDEARVTRMLLYNAFYP